MLSAPSCASTAPCRIATFLTTLLTTLLLAVTLASAQTAVSWQHIGNAAVERSLAGLASGPVDRVWYSADGATLYVHTALGHVWQSTDLENWQDSAAAVAVATNAVVPMLPEPTAQAREAGSSRGIVYAFGEFVYRSEDGGKHWENVTAYRGVSLIGGGLRDLAIAPGKEQEIVVAADAGVFRSLDGGRSWSGLNDAMPNLPATRLLSPPVGEIGRAHV